MSRGRSGDALSPIEKNTMRLNQYDARIAQLEGRMTRQERQWQDFIPAVSKEIGTKIISPWLSHTIQLPTSLDDNRPDPLSIRDFDIQGALDRINQRGKV